VLFFGNVDAYLSCLSTYACYIDEKTP